MTSIEIVGRRIGPGEPVFIIAEAGVNHNGSLEMARQLIDVAAEAGADAVKFQTFRADRLMTRTAPKASYQLQGTAVEESQFEMLRRLELSPDAHRALMDWCQRRSILFLSSPFDEESADFLAELGVPAFKIPSGEMTNLPFLAHIARHHKPMIVSTGMSTMEEVQIVMRTIETAGNPPVALLHCVSCYPARPADANLRSIQTLAAAFDVPVGYSDHTLGIEIALAAVALGACAIEKHVTLDRTLPGPDHCASLEPGELTALVRGIRMVEVALGHGRKEPAPCEAETAAASRKSLIAAHNIPSGTVVTSDMIVLKCPGTGLPPSALDRVVGRVAARDIAADSLMTLDMLQWTEKPG